MMMSLAWFEHSGNTRFPAYVCILTIAIFHVYNNVAIVSVHVCAVKHGLPGYSNHAKDITANNFKKMHLCNLAIGLYDVQYVLIVA